jgi:hypothetical protein
VQQCAWLEYLSVFCLQSDVTNLSDIALNAVQNADQVFSKVMQNIQLLLVPIVNPEGPSDRFDLKSTEQITPEIYGGSRVKVPYKPIVVSKQLEFVVPSLRGVRPLFPSGTGTGAGTGTGTATGTGDSLRSLSPRWRTIRTVAEHTALVLLERLCCARVAFLLVTAVAVVSGTVGAGGTGGTGGQTGGTTRSPAAASLVTTNPTPTVRRLMYAVQESLELFPSNVWLSDAFVRLKSAQPAGSLYVRAFLKDALLCNRSTAVLLRASIDAEIIFAVKRSLQERLLHTTSTGLQGYKNELLVLPHLCILSSHWTDECAHQIRQTFETVLADPIGMSLPDVWMQYLLVEIGRQRLLEAKKVFLRSVNQCGWCRNMFALPVSLLESVFAESERSSLNSLLEQRGVSPV